MATAVQKQIAAFHDSIMQASNAAIAAWDKHKQIQEAILMTPGVVEMVYAAVRNDPDSNRVQSVLNYLLGTMNELLRSARDSDLVDHGFTMNGLPEFKIAMTRLRFLIADAMDGAEKMPVANVKCTGCDSPETFEALAKDLPAPQSWYDEDFTAAQGANC